MVDVALNLHFLTIFLMSPLVSSSQKKWLSLPHLCQQRTGCRWEHTASSVAYQSSQEPDNSQSPRGHLLCHALCEHQKRECCAGSLLTTNSKEQDAQVYWNTCTVLQRTKFTCCSIASVLYYWSPSPTLLSNISASIIAAIDCCMLYFVFVGLL